MAESSGGGNKSRERLRWCQVPERLARSTVEAVLDGGEHRRSTYPEYGLLVRFAAFTGLRAGEIGALQIGRLDLHRRRVEVTASASEARGVFEVGPTKTYERRAVPVPSALVGELEAQIFDRQSDEFVFEGPDGGPVRHSNWYPRFFKPAVKRAALPAGTRFHDLRHSYAAMLIAEGAHPRAIMERLGHSTIQVTIGTYGHLFPHLEEALDSALNDRILSADDLANDGDDGATDTANPDQEDPDAYD